MKSSGKFDPENGTEIVTLVPVAIVVVPEVILVPDRIVPDVLKSVEDVFA